MRVQVTVLFSVKSTVPRYLTLCFVIGWKAAKAESGNAGRNLNDFGIGL